MRAHQQIIADINAFEPIDGEWRKLDTLLDELWKAGDPEKELKALLNIFERFPEEDGAGVLWSVIHGIESFKSDYLPQLVESLHRQPSEMGVVLLRRLLKSDKARFHSHAMRNTVTELRGHPNAPQSVKEELQELLTLMSSAS